MENKTERAVFAAIMLQQQKESQVREYLEELKFLAETDGIEGNKFFTQRLDRANSRTYVGPGKLQEIKDYVQQKEVEYIIFDDELSPSQMRNIEKETGAKVIDRTGLILDIFAQRAKTAYAKTQVELAQEQSAPLVSYQVSPVL